MALPSSGMITMAQINVELQRPWNARLDMNDPQVRSLANVPSGFIALSHLYGKSLIITITGGNANRDSEFPFWGYMIPNATFNKAFGSASSTSFGGGELTSLYTRNGEVVMTVRGVDLGHVVTIQVNGVNYSLTRNWSGGSNEHQYKLDNNALEDVLFYAGLRGQQFTVKKL